MEPIESVYYDRRDALEMAVQYHQIREAVRESTPEGVIETASLFLSWLTGVEVQ